MAVRKKYLFGISKAGNCYNGFFPDFPGCLVTGRTVEDVKSRLPAVLQSHILGMLEDNDDLPEDEDVVDGGAMWVDVPVPELAAN